MEQSVSGSIWGEGFVFVDGVSVCVQYTGKGAGQGRSLLRFCRLVLKEEGRNRREGPGR